MTVYGIRGESAADVADDFAKFKADEDNDALLWTGCNGRHIYMCSKLDWESVREFFKKLDDAYVISVSYTEEAPKECSASES